MSTDQQPSVEPEGAPFARERAFLEQHVVVPAQTRRTRGRGSRTAPGDNSGVPADFRLKLLREYRDRQGEAGKRKAARPRHHTRYARTGEVPR